MHIFYTPDISATSNAYTLNEDESKHCIRVMRLKKGDEIVLIDGKGGWYNAEIMDDNPKKCIVKITRTSPEHDKRAIYLHMAVAPTKNMDRIEWFAEKATELGIEELSMVISNNSERNKINTERLEKVCVAAIKQSQKAYLPKINEATSFKDFIASTNNINGLKFIAHCRETFSEHGKNHLKELYKKNNNVLILIGPEGDFTTEEIQLALNNGFAEINLGNSRLRTETAALYACAIVNMLND